jgi:hypothetical protein
VTDVADVALEDTGQLPPEVAHLRRRLLGYRSSAVDTRLAELSMQLEAERSRADAAELALADAKAALAAELHRPAPTLGDLAMHTAKVHRRAGEQAEAAITSAGRKAKQDVRAAEIKAAQIMRKARHHAMDSELSARDMIERAEADRVRIDSDARRNADRRTARAAAEARLVLAEAQAGVEMVRAERGLRLGHVEADLDELRQLRDELVRSTRSHQDRLGEVIDRMTGD